MKNSITLFVFLFAGISIGFISCQDVSQNAEKIKQVPDQFIFEEQTYSLGWGSLWDYEYEEDGRHHFSIDIYQIEENLEVEDVVINSQYSIWFFGYAEGEDAIPEPGIYTFSQENSDVGFIEIGVLIFWRDKDGKELPNYEATKITSGQVEISKRNEIYVMEFDLKTENGIEVAGSYSDELKQYNTSGFIDAKKSLIKKRPE